MQFSQPTKGTLFENFPRLVDTYRWLILAVFSVFTAVMVLGIEKHFALDVSVEAWFDETSPPFQTKNEFKKLFGSDENVFIIYRPRSGDVFSESALLTLRSLHREIERASVQPSGGNQLTRILAVDSLYNARYQVADGDTLIAKKLIGEDFPSSAEAREKRRAIALSQEGFRRVFYSEDFQYGGIQVKTNFGAQTSVPIEAVEFAEAGNLLDDSDFIMAGAVEAPSVDSDSTLASSEPYFAKVDQTHYQQFMAGLREITDRPEFQDFEFHFVGHPVQNDYMLDTMAEAASLIGAMVFIFIGLLWILFGSLSAVVWPLFVVSLTTLWATGLGCWMGISYTAMWMLTLMLTLAVSIASCIHILSAYLLYQRAGKPHERALAMAYKKTGLPILLTSVTTMVGMLSLSLSSIPAIKGFAYTSAAAVAFVYILVMVLFPILLGIWHPAASVRAKKAWREKLTINMQPFLAWVANFTRRYSKTIVVTYAVIFAVLMIGAFEIKIDTNDSKLSRADTPIRVALELVDESMMGGMALEVLMRFSEPDAMKDPKVLKIIAAWQEDIAQNHSDKVIKTFSLADVVKNTNQVMHGGDPAFHRIPDDPLLTSQLLYLFNNSNPVDRRNLVSDDYSSSHISFMMRNKGTHDYVPFFAKLNEDLLSYFSPLKDSYADMDVQTTGTFKLLMALSDEVTRTQLKTFGTALLIITVLLMITLGSFQSGVIAVIPNILPAVVTFGLMGWLGIPMDGNTLLVAPVIIGIAVDDTIHFMSHYRHSWLELGDVDAAVTGTLREVGQAVTFTSLILGLGFGILSFAEFLGLAKPGFFGFAAIMVALLSDLFFLPALMHWLKPDMGRKKALAVSAKVAQA
ncbi:RND family transporter [Zhongshania sp.]|uniref:efflux RND transporter permease subunit n=1 Tax=Zhongshania sp. TaxID=1971902 RepID=UPI00356424A4